MSEITLNARTVINVKAPKRRKVCKKNCPSFNQKQRTGFESLPCPHGSHLRDCSEPVGPEDGACGVNVGSSLHFKTVSFFSILKRIKSSTLNSAFNFEKL